MSRVSLYSLDVFIPTTQSVTLVLNIACKCQWVTNHREVTSMGLHKDCLFFKILSYIFMNIPLACLILAWIAILYIFKFPIVYQLMCPWLSQNLQWVLSKEYSTVMGIAPRIHMTSKEQSHPLGWHDLLPVRDSSSSPKQEDGGSSSSSSMNDTKDHWVATGPFQNCSSFLLHPQVCHPMWMLIYFAGNCWRWTQKLKAEANWTIGPSYTGGSEGDINVISFLLVLELAN